MDTCAELLVRRADVDHQVPEGLAEPDHRDGRDRVQDELLRGAGLEPRRAREEFGADDRADLVLGDAPDLGFPHGYDTGRAGAGTRRFLDGSQHEGCPSAGAHADDGVERADSELANGSCAGFAVVLGGFPLERRRVLASRLERNDLPRLGRERRLAFRGVELRDPA